MSLKHYGLRNRSSLDNSDDGTPIILERSRSRRTNVGGGRRAHNCNLKCVSVKDNYILDNSKLNAICTPMTTKEIGVDKCQEQKEREMTYGDSEEDTLKDPTQVYSVNENKKEDYLNQKKRERKKTEKYISFQPQTKQNDKCSSCNGEKDYDFWIACNICEKWYHGECVGVVEAIVDNIEIYKCQYCVDNDVDKDQCPMMEEREANEKLEKLNSIIKEQTDRIVDLTKDNKKMSKDREDEKKRVRDALEKAKTKNQNDRNIILGKNNEIQILKDEIQQKKNQMKQMKQNEDDTKKDNKNIENQKLQLLDKNNKLQDKVTELQTKIDQNKNEYDRVKKELSQEKKKKKDQIIDQLQDELEEREQEIENLKNIEYYLQGSLNNDHEEEVSEDEIKDLYQALNTIQNLKVEIKMLKAVKNQYGLKEK